MKPVYILESVRTPRAKANDANGDGVLQKEETKYHVKANFEKIDCDKSNALDGVEIKNFLNGLSCGQKLSDEIIPYAKKYPDGPSPFPAIVSLHSSGGFSSSNIIIENYKSQIWIKAG